MQIKITGYLWINPDLKHWQRLALFWFYVPLLIWRFLIGKPVLLAEYAPNQGLEPTAPAGSTSTDAPTGEAL